MSLAAKYVEVTIKNTDDAVVGHGFTDDSGLLDFALPSGKYKVLFGTHPTGYTLENTIFTEPGTSPVTSTANPVLDVDVIDNNTTSVITNYLQD